MPRGGVCPEEVEPEEKEHGRELYHSLRRKKPKTKMPTRHSPKGDPGGAARAGASTAHAGGTAPKTGPPGAATAQNPGDDAAFWAKMGSMLGGLEERMKQETDQVKEQLAVAVDSIGDLGTRMGVAEKRLDGLVEEVNYIVDRIGRGSAHLVAGSSLINQPCLDCHPTPRPSPTALARWDYLTDKLNYLRSLPS